MYKLFEMKEIFYFFLLSVFYVHANNTKTECNAAEIPTIKCIFPKNMNSTRTDFAVYFYSVNGKADLLVDCWWAGDKISCIEQEGFRCIWPVSDVAEITVPARVVSISGTYKCIPEGSSHENTKPCQFDQHEEQQKETQDKNRKESSLDTPDSGGIMTIEIVGTVVGVVALVLLIVIVVFLLKIYFKKNPNKHKLNLPTLGFEAIGNKKKSKGTRQL